jgi:hypothetical protein
MDKTRVHRQYFYKYVRTTLKANRNNKSWNQLPAGLLVSFPCKLNTFRKWVKNIVTSSAFFSKKNV